MKIKKGLFANIETPDMVKVKTRDRYDYYSFNIDTRDLEERISKELSEEIFRRFVQDGGDATGGTEEDPITIPWEVLLEIIQDITEKQAAKKAREPRTFAFPSHDVMFTLLALFSGKTDRIPRRLLLKPLQERTPEERKEADAFLDSIIQRRTAAYDPQGKPIKEIVAIVSDNPKVEAWAGIPESLFCLDERVREEALAIRIKEQYKAKGLRHLLALIIGLEDEGRTGTFIWTVKDHLKRLGIKKKSHGHYDYDEKKTATAVVGIFASLIITARSKDRKGIETISGERLFSIVGFSLQKFQDEIINEAIKIRAEDFWYRNAFQATEGKAPQYTKLLREVARENHRNHPLTIYLAPLLAIWWRMNPERKLSIESIMDWCDLDYSYKNRNRMKELRDLESELNYMKGKGYLGDWANSGEDALPSNCKDPFNCVLTLSPPEWLRDELKAIEDKRDKPLIMAPPVISLDEFKAVFEGTGLSRRQFANNLGITPQMVGYLLTGQRKMTRSISDKVRELYPDRGRS